MLRSPKDKELEHINTSNAQHHNKVANLQCDKINLQSALATQAIKVAKANEKIQTLQTTLETTRNELEYIKATFGTFRREHGIEVARLQSDKSELQSSLDVLQASVVEANQRLTPGIAAVKQWMCQSSVDIGTTLPLGVSNSPSSSSDEYNIHAYDALPGARSENWSSAYEDAKLSIDIRPSSMGYIVKALSQIKLGGLEEAMQVFDLAFRNCNPNESNLLLLIKSIILFVAGKSDNAISRMHDLIAISRGDDETLFCYIQVLGEMYLMQGDYERAVQSLERGLGLASPSAGCDLETISLVCYRWQHHYAIDTDSDDEIFGWSFDGLQITAQRYHCEVLQAAGHAEEAAEALLKILETFGESEVTAGWVTDLQKRCVEMLEALGDAALSSGEHGEAIARYSSALSLQPSIDTLLKRSKARALKGLWEDVWRMRMRCAIEFDPSSHRGYERKYVALHGAGDYGEAIDAVLCMLSNIGNSPSEEIRRLQETYTLPCETIAAIDQMVHDLFKLCPLVLIDVTTGQLCDAEERVRMFKSETSFKKLVSEATIAQIDEMCILQVVAKYFEWIMFSHTWEGKEPTLQDVNLIDSIWHLDKSPQNEKLRRFCTVAREGGCRWVWSDTCCIDKGTSAVLSQSLTSMYRWYMEAAATLVYLADVPSPSQPGDLTKSRWMTRAWTLQELLASRVIRFYDRDWKPYLNDMCTNHKESFVVQEELALAMGVAPGTISSFRPEDLGVREKLRLASTRNATMEEDIAYALIGIFSSDIVPRYGLGKTALGHLLENIVAHSGDVTVIAWTGKSMPYNSALPASFAVYSEVPHSPPPLEADELDTRVEQLRTRCSPEDALTFYYRVIQLPRAIFSNRCLQLPCIVFSVKKIGVQELGGSQENLYRTTVALLGKVEFRTADVMPLKKPRNIVFVHPWLHDLREPLDGFVSDDEPELDSYATANDELEAESIADSGGGTDNTSTPTSPLHSNSLARVDPYTQAFRFIVRLERPFNALLLERQMNGQYKRVATEHEIIVPGVKYRTNPKGIRAKVLEIV